MLRNTSFVLAHSPTSWPRGNLLGFGNRRLLPILFPAPKLNLLFPPNTAVPGVASPQPGLPDLVLFKDFEINFTSGKSPGISLHFCNNHPPLLLVSRGKDNTSPSLTSLLLSKLLKYEARSLLQYRQSYPELLRTLVNEI